MMGTMSIASQYEEYLMAKQAMKPGFSQKLFVWGLLVMKVGAWASEAETTFGIPSVVKYLSAIFILVSMFYMMYQRPLTLKYYGAIGLAVAVFSLYSLFLVYQTFRLDTRYFQFLFGAKYYVLPFLIPVLILFTKFDMKFVSYLIRYSLKFLPWLYLVLFTVVATLNQDNWYEHLWRLHIFNFALPFVLLNIHYLNGKARTRNLLILFYLALMLVGAIYGRRGYVIDIIMLFGFYYLIMSMNRVVSTARKVRSFMIVAVAIFVFILMLGFLQKNLYIFERGLSSEGFEESRGSVFKEFFSDFGTKSGDWIWGRGLDGKVLRSLDTEGGGYGDTVENGYLYMFLKAGGFYLVLMMLILLVAAYRGWFQSRNQMSRSLSAIIFMHLIGMISFNLPVFNAEYAMVWISAVLCYSKDIRNLTDKEVQLLLNL